MKSENSAEPKEVYFTSLRYLSARDDKVFHRMHLRDLFMNGDIPLMSAIEVEDAAGLYRVPVSSIIYCSMVGDWKYREMICY